MRNENVMREFETENFIVRVSAEEENDLDLSFDEDGSVLEGLQNGTFIAFVAKAEVIHKETGDSLATDYLGGCIYRSFKEFMDHKECGTQNRKYEAEGDSGRCGSYFAQMITTVCEEARKEIKKRAATYSAIAVRA